MNTIRAGFIGTGAIARTHAWALNSLKYYYNDAPAIETVAACSARKESREAFAGSYGFEKACSIEEFVNDDTINTVFVLTPNKLHYEHFKAAINMASVRRIYLEKPVCSSEEEAQSISRLALGRPEVKIQVGFQYLFSPAVREALSFWKSGILGKPVHFDIKYYHSDYLKKEYRNKRLNRLTPAPDGGAMADLGSHAISLLIAFMGSFKINGAIQAGSFDDVDKRSDLFGQIMLYNPGTGVAGTLSASRITSGSGDDIVLEFFAENGALRYASAKADCFEYYSEDTGVWTKKTVGSMYRNITSFPSAHVPPGWLRAMAHAHYVFLTGTLGEVFVPDIDHGLAVQEMVVEAARQFDIFRQTLKAES
ncbi:MAG: Gfo/Idh/MocA family oxidoreductase [Bacteroidales bacterium]|jgi:predicted dehydrogenase|nr:Gfo/Idh/MocA family oxidoreductase [Bacteroidales bacterium]